VVDINIGVPAGFYFEINERVLGQGGQHVIVKRNRRGDGRFSCPIKI